MILVGLDESEESFRALEFAIEEGKLRNMKVVAVHSLKGGSKTTTEDIQKGEEILDKAKKLAEERGVDFESHLLVRGYEPGEDIVNFAKEIDAFMIVMGTRKRSAVEKLLLGSVAQYVVTKAKQPVVVVK
jgi:nucleotide-binding universal stress UspA family protein